MGKGSPVGVGDLNIGWRDDFGKYHGFMIPKVFHIPTSPVDILGVSAFSQAIGNYHKKGTGINSSGQDSIFLGIMENFKRLLNTLKPICQRW